MDASSPPLSGPGPRRDPRSHRNTGPGAPAPYSLACPPPGDAGQAGRQDTLRARDPARAGPQDPPRQGHQLPPSFKSPPLRLARPESRGPGSASPPPALCVCAKPAVPSPAIVPTRAPRSPPGRPPRRGAGRAPRPDPPRGTHSGAAAAPASWGPSGLPTPRPARSRRLCRASVRPAGSQPSRQAGQTRAPVLPPAAWLRAAQSRPAPRRGQRRGGAAGGRHAIGPLRGGGGAGAGPGRTPPPPPNRARAGPRPSALRALPLAPRGCSERPRDPPGSARWGGSRGLRAPVNGAKPLSPGCPI